MFAKFARNKKEKEEEKIEPSKFKEGEWVIKDTNEEQRKLLSIISPNVLLAKKVVGTPNRPFRKEIKMFGERIRTTVYDLIIDNEGRDIEVDSSSYRLATEEEVNEKRLRSIFK